MNGRRRRPPAGSRPPSDEDGLAGSGDGESEDPPETAEKAAGRLPRERVLELRERIRVGGYDRAEVAEQVARVLIRRGLV